MGWIDLTQGGSIYLTSIFETLHVTQEVAASTAAPDVPALHVKRTRGANGRMATRIEQDDPPFDVEARRLRLCRELLVERQIIARYLKKQDWSHAGWILLLELSVPDTVDKRLPGSSLGYASGVSIPTAPRQERKTVA